MCNFVPLNVGKTPLNSSITAPIGFILELQGDTGDKTFPRTGDSFASRHEPSMMEAVFDIVDQPFEIQIVLKSGHCPAYRNKLRCAPSTAPTEPKLAEQDDDSITLAGSSSSSSASSSSDTPDVCFDDCELDGTILVWDYPGLGLSIEVSPVGSCTPDADADDVEKKYPATTSQPELITMPEEQVVVAEIMAVAMAAAYAAAAELVVVDAKEGTSAAEVVSIDCVDSCRLETICEEDATAEIDDQAEMEALAAALGGDAPIGLEPEEQQVLLQMRRQAHAEEQRSGRGSGPASDARASPVVAPPPPKRFETASIESVSFADLRKVWGDRQGTPAAPVLLSRRSSRSSVAEPLADAAPLDEKAAPAAADDDDGTDAAAATADVTALDRVGLAPRDPEDLDTLDEIRCNGPLGLSRSPALMRVRDSDGWHAVARSSSPVMSTQLIWLTEQLTRLAVCDGESSAPPSFTRPHGMSAEGSKVTLAARRPSFFFAAKRGAAGANSSKRRWRIIRVRFMDQFKFRARRTSAG